MEPKTKTEEEKKAVREALRNGLEQRDKAQIIGLFIDQWERLRLTQDTLHEVICARQVAESHVKRVGEAIRELKGLLQEEMNVI